MAAGVMAGGLLLALLFRHPAGRADLPGTLNSDPLVVRKQQPTTPTMVQPAERFGNRMAVNPSGLVEPRRAVPTVVTPSDRPAPAPDLAKSYPEVGPLATSRWGISMGEMLPGPQAGIPQGGTVQTSTSQPVSTARQAHPTTHKIMDGDSLALLAERYLGSAQRAMEIFQANRDVLSHPQILPIGAELKIPPQGDGTL